MAVQVFSFGFGFAVILYDMWLVVDLLGQISLTVKQRLKRRACPDVPKIVRKGMPVT